MLILNLIQENHSVSLVRFKNQDCFVFTEIINQFVIIFVKFSLMTLEGAEILKSGVLKGAANKVESILSRIVNRNIFQFE